MIFFHTVRWKNFLSTGNYFLEVPLDQSQDTLIVGKNGSGKSTLLDAICFALFGKPFRKVNKPTLVNSTNQRNCVVELEFTIDQHRYKIVRGIEPIIFEIYKDGVLVDQETSVGDYQDYFEKFTLKCSYKSFTQIVVLGSASFTPFMQLKAADRRSIIEDLLDIQIFSTMHTLIKKRLSSNKEQCTITKLKIENGRDKEKMQQAHILELQQNKEDLILEYQQDSLKAQTEILNIQDMIKANVAVVAELGEQIKGKPKISADITKLLKLEAQFTQTQTKHNKTITFFDSNDTCPTCTQTIDSTFKQGKTEAIREKQVQCVEALQKIQDTLANRKQELAAIEAIEKRMNTLKTSIVSGKTSIAELQKTIDSLTSKINENTVRASVTGKEHEQLQVIQQEIEESTKQHHFFINEKAYLEIASTLLKDTGIKAQIIKQYLPIINSLTNKHLAALDFFVNFNLDETFQESIKSRHRDEFSYYSFSQGQKMRIDMALMLTWRAIAKMKNSVDTNLLILDEIFDSSLDAAGADELMKILHLLQGNIFIISHRGDILMDKFSKTIRFVEQQNFSHIAV